MSSTSSQCIATTKAGTRCRCYALPGEEFCWFHSPDKRQERKRARSRGGLARHGRELTPGGDGDRVKLASVGDALGLLERGAGDLLALETSVARVRALCYLVSVALKALEVGDLEERIARLELEFGG